MLATPIERRAKSRGQVYQMMKETNDAGKLRWVRAPEGYRGQGTWFIDYVDAAGKRHRKATDAQNEKRAEDILNKRLAAKVDAVILGITNPDTIDLTLSDFIEKTYLPHLRTKYRSGTTGNHERYAERIIKSLGALKLRQIGKTEVDNFFDGLKRDGKTDHGTPLAKATINRIMSFLRATLYKAQERGIIDRNPCARIELPDEENERKRVMTRAEEERLMTHAKPFLQPIIQTALLSGLRLGEITGLQWAEDATSDKAHKVDLDQGLIFVSHASKSHKCREVPVLPELAELLDPKNRWTGPDGKSPYVFPDQGTGKALHKRTIQHAFEKAVKDSKIRDLHFHDLRRTFASRLAERGVGLGTIAALLGHGATYVTERYTWMAADHLREAMGRLSNPGSAPHSPRSQGRYKADGETDQKDAG